MPSHVVISIQAADRGTRSMKEAAAAVAAGEEAAAGMETSSPEEALLHSRDRRNLAEVPEAGDQGEEDPIVAAVQDSPEKEMGRHNQVHRNPEVAREAVARRIRRSEEVAGCSLHNTVPTGEEDRCRGLKSTAVAAEMVAGIRSSAVSAGSPGEVSIFVQEAQAMPIHSLRMPGRHFPPRS